MRSMIRSSVWALALLGVLALPSRSDACSCVSQNHPCEAAWKVDAVFVAQVLDVIPDPARRRPTRIRVRVLETFRGEPPNDAILTTSAELGNCGYDGFSVGETYLVYAGARSYLDGTSSRLDVSLCSRTRRISEAAEDLAYLRTMAGASPSRGAILGTAVRDDATLNALEPFAGLVVTAESNGSRYQAVSDDQGRYRLDVPPGRYELTAETPPGLSVRELLGPYMLRDARACVSWDPYVQIDGRVAGRVVDARGDPAPGRLVKIVSESNRDLVDEDIDVTGDDGAFEFRRLEPGTYRIAVIPALERSDSGTIGVPASGIALKSGERVTLRDLVIPDGQAMVLVEGIVRTAAGLPLANATVYLIDATEGGMNRTFARSRKTDPDGRYRVAAEPGRLYRLVGEFQPRHVIGEPVPDGEWSWTVRSWVFSLTMDAVIDLQFDR